MEEAKEHGRHLFKIFPMLTVIRSYLLLVTCSQLICTAQCSITALISFPLSLRTSPNPVIQEGGERRILMQKLFRTEFFTPPARRSPALRLPSLNFSGSCWLALGQGPTKKFFSALCRKLFFVLQSQLPPFRFSPLTACINPLCLSITLFPYPETRPCFCCPVLPRPSSARRRPYLRPAINILALVHFFSALFSFPPFSLSHFSFSFVLLPPSPLSIFSLLHLSISSRFLSRKPRRLVLCRARHVVFDFLFLFVFLDTGIDAPRGRFFFPRRYPSVSRSDNPLSPSLSTYTHHRYHGLKS